MSGVRLGDTLKIVLTDQQFAGFLKVVDFTSEEEARAALQRREVGVILIIPADFSQAGVALDRQSTITLIKDPTLTMGPAILRISSASIWTVYPALPLPPMSPCKKPQNRV